MKQGLSTAQIVFLVVLAAVLLPVMGTVLLIAAYGLLHNPPRHDPRDAVDAAVDAADVVDAATGD